MAESSLAADLLADFNDDSDNDEDLDLQNGDLNLLEATGIHSTSRSLGLDGDEENDEDEDMGETEGVGRTVGNGAGVRRHSESELADDDDEEARKAKVEKMHLGGVDDVRSVAGLMKILEPVLVVCDHLSHSLAPMSYSNFRWK